MELLPGPGGFGTLVGSAGEGNAREPATENSGEAPFQKLALDMQNSHTSRAQERAHGMAESFNKNTINFHSRF